MTHKLTTQQAAKRLGIGDDLVRRYIREGRFGIVERFGQRAFTLTEAQLSRFIRARQTPSRLGRPPKPVPETPKA